MTVMAKFPILPLTPTGPVPRSTATTWVMRTPEGDMVPIKVTDMTDQHIWRWIRLFRRKWRERGFTGTDEELDKAIQRSIITAPAIYAEAINRQCMPSDALDVISNVLVSKVKATHALGKATPKPAKVEPGPPGIRRIDLDED